VNKRQPDLDHWDSMGVCELTPIRVDIHEPVERIPSWVEVSGKIADRRSGDTTKIS